MKKLLVILLALAMILGTLACTVDSGSNATSPTREPRRTESSGNNGHDDTEKTTPEPEDATPEPEVETPEPTEVPKKDVYSVGDVLEAEGLRLTYMASGEYKSDNKYSQPEEGNKFIFLRFYVENIGKDDENISTFDFDCYADGYNCDSYYGGDDDLSATLSPGRTTTGCVYFEIPKDAEEVEIEYEVNFWTEEKAKFAFEGDKDSGFVPENNSTATEDAYHPGDVAETKELKITYISAEETESDNMFIQPKEGFHYVTFSFEFENISKSDVYVSSLSFDCFADGAACEGSYFRDDDLSTVTLSAGRKVKGTVTFEVPDGAKIVEVEFDEISLFGSRIVFSF